MSNEIEFIDDLLIIWMDADCHRRLVIALRNVSNCNPEGELDYGDRNNLF